MGTPKFAVPTLEKLNSKYHVVEVFTQPPRLSGRGMNLKKNPIQIFAEKNNLPVNIASKIKDNNIISHFKKIKADIIIVVAYGLILPEEILNIFRYGCVNGHASLLPRWRGAAPIQRSIEAGDKVTGCTSMLMEKGLDTGPILHKKKLTIKPNDNYLTIHDKLSNITSICIDETIQKIISGKITLLPQNKSKVTYANKLVKSEGLINWKENAFKIYNKIRAFKYFPGTYFYYNGAKINLIDGIPIIKKHNKKSGYIIDVNKSIKVACDRNSVFQILTIQKEGKNIMPIKDFLNGSKIKVGDFV